MLVRSFSFLFKTCLCIFHHFLHGLHAPARQIPVAAMIEKRAPSPALLKKVIPGFKPGIKVLQTFSLITWLYHRMELL